MIVSVTEQYDHIMSMLTDNQRKNWRFRVELANELIRFLKPFKEASDHLEAENYPTSTLILVWRTEIYEHLTEGNFFGPVKIIAKFALHYLEQKLPVLEDYKISCFLDRRYRHLNMLTDNARNQALQEILNLMNEIPDENESPAKKPRYSIYEGVVDNRDEHELQSYIQILQHQNKLCKSSGKVIKSISQNCTS